jgi:hypothetical protein
VRAHELVGCLRALEALRQSKPGIVIDDKNDWTIDVSDYQLTTLSEDENAHRPDVAPSFPWLHASLWTDTLPDDAKSLPW